MAETYRTDAELTALSATTPTCGAPYPTANIDPWLVPYYKQLSRLCDAVAVLTGLEVFKDGDLTCGIRAGRFIHAGAIVTYAGATAQALTNNDVNYIYVNQVGTLTINATGFPATTHIPLAEITTSGGVYSIDSGHLVDRRQSGMFHTYGQIELREYPIHASALRNDDWSDIDVTTAAGKFNLSFGGFGTGTLTIDAEAASNNTKTDTLWFEFTMPINYVASGDVKFTIKAIETDEAQVSSTISADVRESDLQGGVGADLAASWEDADITTSWDVKTLTITDAGLVAGDTIRVGIRVVTNDTTGGGGAQVKLDDLRMKCDVYQEF